MEELADLVKLHYMFYNKQNYSKYLPDGVSVLNEYSDDNSMVFADGERLIISMRGLDPTSLSDLQIGMNIVMGDVLNPKGFDFETSKGKYKQILNSEQVKIEELQNRFPGKTIELVGHSRGGRKAIDLGKHNDLKHTAFNPGDATSFRQKLYSVFLHKFLPSIDKIDLYNDMLLTMPNTVGRPGAGGLRDLGNMRLGEHLIEWPWSHIYFEPNIVPQQYTIGQMIERLVYNPNVYEAISSSAVVAAGSVGGGMGSFATTAFSSLVIPIGLELLYSGTMGRNSYHGDAARLNHHGLGRPTRARVELAESQMNRDEMFKGMKDAQAYTSLPVNPSNVGTKNIYSTANDIISWGYKGKWGENVNIIDNKNYVKSLDPTHHSLDHFISRDLYNRIESDKEINNVLGENNLQNRFDRERFESSNSISATEYNTAIGNVGGQPRRPLDVKSFCEEYPELAECKYQAGTL